MSSSSTPDETLVVGHIIFMTLTFAIIFPAGITCALRAHLLSTAIDGGGSSSSSSHHLRAHKWLQRTGIFTCFMGFCFIVQYLTQARGLDHFKDPHHVLGTVTLVVCVLQGAFAEIRPPAVAPGTFSPISNIEEGDSTAGITSKNIFKRVWTFVHAFVGTAILAMGSFNIVLGVQYIVRRGDVEAHRVSIVYGVWVLSLLGCVGYLLRARCLRRRDRKRGTTISVSESVEMSEESSIIPSPREASVI